MRACSISKFGSCTVYVLFAVSASTFVPYRSRFAPSLPTSVRLAAGPDASPTTCAEPASGWSKRFASGSRFVTATSYASFDSPVSPSASVPAALAFTSGPVRTSSLMSAVWLANEPVTWPESIAIPAIVDFFSVAVPLTSSSSVGPTFGTVSATAMSADPFSVVPASSLRSVNSDPGSSSNGPVNFA